MQVAKVRAAIGLHAVVDEVAQQQRAVLDALNLPQMECTKKESSQLLTVHQQALLLVAVEVDGNAALVVAVADPLAFLGPRLLRLEMACPLPRLLRLSPKLPQAHLHPLPDSPPQRRLRQRPS
jgi:hypothetical protein